MVGYSLDKDRKNGELQYSLLPQMDKADDGTVRLQRSSMLHVKRITIMYTVRGRCLRKFLTRNFIT